MLLLVAACADGITPTKEAIAPMMAPGCNPARQRKGQCVPELPPADSFTIYAMGRSVNNTTWDMAPNDTVTVCGLLWYGPSPKIPDKPVEWSTNDPLSVTFTSLSSNCALMRAHEPLGMFLRSGKNYWAAINE